MASTHETITQTLSMLEERLKRIEFVLIGDNNGTQDAAAAKSTSSTVNTRIRNLERSLNALVARSYAASDVLQLHSQHPDLFHSVDQNIAPSTLPAPSLAQLVLAHDQLYASSASQLSLLRDSSTVPDPAALAKLVALQPRLDKAQSKQAEIAQEVAKLRTQSAKLLERWYQDGVLDMGQKWAEWEENLRDGEILLRRKEAAQRREEGLV